MSSNTDNNIKAYNTQKKVSVILPTYNEKDCIIKLIEEIKKNLSLADVKKEIVIVDDNSPDGTADVIKKAYSQDSEVVLKVREQERGLASAIRRGIEWSTGDIIIVMDTDFNHDPKTIPQMIDFLNYYDVIGGSRFTMGGGMRPAYRYLGSYFFNLMIRVILRTQVQDNLSGYFSFRREKIFTLNFDKIFFGYGDYYFRMLYYAHINGFKILEVPVVYLERLAGESKTRIFPVFFKYLKALLKFKRVV